MPDNVDKLADSVGIAEHTCTCSWCNKAYWNDSWAGLHLTSSHRLGSYGSFQLNDKGESCLINSFIHSLQEFT